MTCLLFPDKIKTCWLNLSSTGSCFVTLQQRESHQDTKEKWVKSLAEDNHTSHYDRWQTLTLCFERRPRWGLFAAYFIIRLYVTGKSYFFYWGSLNITASLQACLTDRRAFTDKHLIFLLLPFTVWYTCNEWMRSECWKRFLLNQKKLLYESLYWNLMLVHFMLSKCDPLPSSIKQVYGRTTPITSTQCCVQDHVEQQAWKMLSADWDDRVSSMQAWFSLHRDE